MRDRYQDDEESGSESDDYEQYEQYKQYKQYKQDKQEKRQSKKNGNDTKTSNWLDAVPTNDQIVALTESKLFIGVREWLLRSGSFDLTTAIWVVSMLVLAKSYGSSTLSGIKNYGTNAVHPKPSSELATKLCDWVAEHGQAKNSFSSWCKLPTFQQVEVTEIAEQRFGCVVEEQWGPNDRTQPEKRKLGLQASNGKSVFFFGGKLFMLERSGHVVDGCHTSYNSKREDEKITLRCFWGNTKPLSNLLRHVEQHSKQQSAKLLIKRVERIRTQTLACHTDLFESFDNLPTKCVVVIEDIDAYNILREGSSEKEKIRRELEEAQKVLEKKKTVSSTKKSTPAAPAMREASHRGRGGGSGRSEYDRQFPPLSGVVEPEFLDDEESIESLSDLESEIENAQEIVTRLAGRLNALHKQEKTRITLSGLLNAIDGPGAKEGRFLILTTNAIKSLDGALRRHGRCDKTWYMGRSSPAMAAITFRRLFGQDPNRTHSLTDIHRLSIDFGKQVAPDTFAPCEIQEYCVSHRGQPEEAVADWQRYVQIKASGEDDVQYDINDELQVEPDYLASAPEDWDKALDGYDMYMKGLQKMTERSAEKTITSPLQKLRSDSEDSLPHGESLWGRNDSEETVLEACCRPKSLARRSSCGAAWYGHRIPYPKAATMTTVHPVQNSTDNGISDFQSADFTAVCTDSTATVSCSSAVTSKLESYRAEDHGVTAFW
ncbi:hypothetical protein K491DRAFT_682973 [Lophiostoma macrostomum CBS 122681]|uniref:ATPase AAA-type core domain-containing protein n=1 Tax=Lophiostoma macrostomum CBS 122681 TaxID=1314788 RepID=A0A6A6SVJ1_9PLEO|nr:hypothetical protein K491DRAFT_682973 [Lophiostoma macrostomum CBS 122681]